MPCCAGYTSSHSTFTTETAAKTVPQSEPETIAAARVPRDAEQAERRDATYPASRQHERRLVLHGGRGSCSSLELESGYKGSSASADRKELGSTPEVGPWKPKSLLVPLCPQILFLTCEHCRVDMKAILAEAEEMEARQCQRASTQHPHHMSSS